jgi:hypothetical protein
MSHIIIVKVERVGNNELLAGNFDSRYQQRIAATPEIDQMIGNRPTIFAEALLKNGSFTILRRARDRHW